MKYKKLFLLTFLAIAGSKTQTMDKALALATIKAQNEELKLGTARYLEELDRAAFMVEKSDDMMAKFKCHGATCRAVATARAEQAKLWDSAAAQTERLLNKHGIRHKEKVAKLPGKAKPAPRLVKNSSPRPRKTHPAKSSSSRPVSYVTAPWDR